VAWYRDKLTGWEGPVDRSVRDGGRCGRARHRRERGQWKRDVDTICIEVRGVIEEKVASGAGEELVMSSGRGVGIAGTTKDSKVGI
jgi:hypothetical protein